MSPRSKEMLSGIGDFINKVGIPTALLILGGWFFGKPALERHIQFIDATEELVRSTEQAVRSQTEVLQLVQATVKTQTVLLEAQTVLIQEIHAHRLGQASTK